MKKRKEKRKPIICPYCQEEMVSMNRFESAYKLIRGFYVWYICPRRKGEEGCGHSVLLQISPKTNRPRRIVSSVEFKKGRSKRQPQK